MVVDWIMFFKAMRYFSTFEFTFWSCYNLPALMLMYSNLQGFQMLIGHEVCHKASKFNRVVGTLHQIKNLYVHFVYEHLYGHHRRVAT